MSVEERLLKLERENRSLKLTVFGLAIGAVFWLALVTVTAIVGVMRQNAVDRENVAATTGTFGTLRADRLEVGGTMDSPRLVADEMDGGFHLALNDPGKTSAVVIRASAGRGDVMAQGGDDFATLSNDGLAVLRNRDSPTSDGRKFDVALTIGRSESTGGGMVELYNPLGKRVVSVESNKVNEGLVMVNDANGEPKNALSTTNRGR